MKKIYITGISGTGKSTIIEELTKKGIHAIDLDSSFCRWEDKITREKVNVDYKIEKHGWYCNVNKLKKLLNIQENIIISGITENQNEYLKFFDKIFLLQCSEETILKRIYNRKNNDFGKDPLEKEYILSFYRDFEKKLIEKGAVSINVDKPIEIIINEIISKFRE